MREIKFRAWDNVMDRMYHVGEEKDIVFELTGGNFIAVDITEDEDEFATLHHLEYMQYTGLKDKNGREIFEGDIMPVNGHNYVVVYHEEYARFCLQTKSGRMFIPSKNSKVIGNIFENSELLEAEK